MGFARCIAEEMELTDSQIQSVEFAGKLTNLGKILRDALLGAENHIGLTIKGK